MEVKENVEGSGTLRDCAQWGAGCNFPPGDGQLLPMDLTTIPGWYHLVPLHCQDVYDLLIETVRFTQYNNDTPPINETVFL